MQSLQFHPQNRAIPPEYFVQSVGFISQLTLCLLQKSRLKLSRFNHSPVLSVMPWQIMSSVPCCLSSTTTSSWSQGRVGLARRRPPKKSYNSMQLAAQVPDSWTMFETDCFSPIQCLRLVTCVCQCFCWVRPYLDNNHSFLWTFCLPGVWKC